MNHALPVVDDEFFENAPFLLHAETDLPHSPEQVCAAMSGDDMGSWVTGLDRSTWVTPRPLGPGSIRTLRLARLITITEDYYRWEELRRQTFRVTHITHRILSGWAEDMRIERRADGGTHLSWSMALDGRLFRLLKVPAFLRPVIERFCVGMVSGIRTILPPPQRQQ